MIKLRVFTWGDDLEFSGWAQCSYKDPCKRDTGGSGQRMRYDDGNRGERRGRFEGATLLALKRRKGP